ncbi:hypothetical protein D4R49_01885 [bacterium]|nr:MAG: hypothetical protein D4R49_01885 [bacterium]
MIVHITVVLILFSVLSTASAQELTGVRVEPQEITVGKSVQITVDFKGPGNNATCGILLNFGDGGSEYIRIEENKLPLRLAHTYDRVGIFPVSAEGQTKFRGFNTSLACGGPARSAAVSVRAEDFAVREAAEQAAKEAAFKRAATERQAAEHAAEQATAQRIAAEQNARKATVERSATERSVERATADRRAAEKAATTAASAKAAAERGAARQEAARQSAEKSTADRLAAQRATKSNDSNEPSGSLPPESDAQKKPAKIKARSAMDL